MSNSKIYQDTNPKHFPYYILIGVYTNRVLGSEYRGFNSLSDAKQWIKDYPEDIYL